MLTFAAEYSDKIQGVLSGFDRLIFRGSLRRIAYTFGMNSYLWANQILLKNFGAHANEVSDRVKEASLRCVQQSGRRNWWIPVRGHHQWKSRRPADYAGQSDLP